MAEFKFDINKSAQENIDLFLALMSLVNEEMAKLLIGNMNKMTPFPSQNSGDSICIQAYALINNFDS